MHCLAPERLCKGKKKQSMVDGLISELTRKCSSVIMNQHPAFVEMSDLFSHYYNNCSIISLPCTHMLGDFWMASFFNLVVVHFMVSHCKCLLQFIFVKKMWRNLNYVHLTALCMKHRKTTSFASFQFISWIVFFVPWLTHVATCGPWVRSASWTKALFKNIINTLWCD